MTAVATFAPLCLRADGRHLVGLIVPYNSRTTHPVDGTGLREMFAPGSVLNTDPSAITLTWRHAPHDLAATLGAATDLTDGRSGMSARFGVLDGDADRLVGLIAAGMRPGLSVGYHPASHHIDGDTIVRTGVLVDHVAVLPNPAYAAAAITALREAGVDVPRPEVTPPRKLARLASLNIARANTRS